MAQDHDNTAAITDTINALLTEMLDRTASALSTHSGASEPSYKVLGTLWVDTSTTPDSLKIYDGTASRTILPDITATGGGLATLTAAAFTTAAPTSAVAASGSTDLTRKGEVDAMVQTSHVWVSIASNTTDAEVPLGTFPACTIVEAYILSDTATSGSGATQRYGFNIKNRDVDGTGTNELAAADLKTDASELAAYDPIAIGLDQNLTVTAGQALTMLIDVDNGGGNPTDLSSAEVAVSITYKVAV